MSSRFIYFSKNNLRAELAIWENYASTQFSFHLIPTENWLEFQGFLVKTTISFGWFIGEITNLQVWKIAHEEWIFLWSS